MHIHSEDLAYIRRIAEEAARGRPPIVLSSLLDSLTAMAQSHPQTLLELLRHIDGREPLAPGPYEGGDDAT